MPSSMVALVTGRLGGGQDDAISKALNARSDRAFALVEQRLGRVDYFAGGRFTAADIIMMFPLSTMRAFAARDLSANRNTQAYLKRIAARPAYQRAMAKADPGFTPPLA